MGEKLDYNNWTSYLNGFNKRNRWRPTRLEVFGEMGAQVAERGLPLVGITMEEDREGSARIHIMLGEHDAIDPRHLTYTITRVSRVTPKRGTDGLDEALEIEDEQGERNLLLFEQRPLISVIH
jgi:Family of unknown function (DUF5335)